MTLSHTCSAGHWVLAPMYTNIRYYHVFHCPATIHQILHSLTHTHLWGLVVPGFQLPKQDQINQIQQRTEQQQLLLPPPQPRVLVVPKYKWALFVLDERRCNKHAHQCVSLCVSVWSVGQSIERGSTNKKTKGN